MVLCLSGQYPYNFVALAMDVLELPFDEHALAKIDAFEVDVFIHERSKIEQEAVEYALSEDKPGPAKSEYKGALAGIISAFGRHYYNGRFSLMSLADYNGLTISWADVKNVITHIDRLKDDCHALSCLFETRDTLAMLVLNVDSYAKRCPQVKDEEIRQIEVCDLPMESTLRQLLRDNNIKTVGDLTLVTADYLMGLRGFGDRRLESVRECLKKCGAHLLGE